MKTKAVTIFLALVLLLVCVTEITVPVRASDDVRPCMATIYGNILFEGNEAICDASVADVDSKIILTISLWHGSQWLQSWSKMGVHFAVIEGRYPVESGETYTLRVESIVDGVQQQTITVVRTAP